MHCFTTRLILASSSPRRRDLLQAVGQSFVIETAHVDESRVEADTPEKLAVARARLKAAAVAGSSETVGFVIGADTIIVKDGDILGKPADAEDARRTLRRLAGHSHDVITGVAVCPTQGAAVATRDELTSGSAADEGQKESRRRIVVTPEGDVTGYERTTVIMRAFSEAEIERYVATGEPLDKAGSYGIQERGGLLVDGIVGDYFNVVGLPLGLLRAMLARFNIHML